MPPLSPAARQALRELEDQGSSEAAAVADCLRSVAANVPEEDPDAYLAACAQEIAQHALAAASRLSPRTVEPIIHLLLGVEDVQDLFRVDAVEAAEFLRNHQHEILDNLDNKVTQLLRDYGEIDELPLVDDDEPA
jgi:hypothetical protein